MPDNDARPYLKPLPYLEAEDRPYFEALQRGELYFQRCQVCGRSQFHPRALCCHCLAPHPQWCKSAGRGRLYSFAVTYHSPLPGFRESTPYIVAYVEIEDGLRLMTNLVDCALAEVKIGMEVEAVFAPATAEISLLNFRPARPDQR